jgi:LmbE family N-acetylglucosaminyl deacetylase
LKDSGGYSDATNLTDIRITEDKIVTTKLGLKVIDFGLTDALFRKKRQQNLLGKIIPEFDHVYPTYRWHITNKVDINDPEIDKLKEKLSKLNKNNVLVFVPYGIGNHVDHIITRKVCEEIFDNVILYSDFPYNVRLNNYGDTASGLQRFELNPDFKKKDRLIKLYKSQFVGLFPNGILPEHKEVYFINK